MLIVSELGCDLTLCASIIINLGGCSVCAEFDHYLDVPVPVPSVTLLQDWITNYYDNGLTVGYVVDVKKLIQACINFKLVIFTPCRNRLEFSPSHPVIAYPSSYSSHIQLFLSAACGE